MVKTKKSAKFYLALVIFSLVGQVAWVVENMYLNVFIYKMFHASASDISLMVAASAVTATLTTVLMGALSDRVGKRKLFICGGYILWGIVTGMFGFITKENVANLFNITDEAKILGTTVWFVILMDIVMTFMGSTSNDAAFQAWMTDVTVPKTCP